MEIKIIDIFWDRIYLNLLFQGKEIEDKQIFLVSESQKIKLEVIKISEDTYKSVINITNINNVIMLKNEDYNFVIEENSTMSKIGITSEVGYKLESLDRIYRYTKNNFAYTVSFNAEELEEKITLVLISRFMLENNKYKKERILGNKNKIKKAIFSFGKYGINVYYKLCSAIHPNKKNKILLMSETRAPISGNLKALDERIKEREIDKKYKVSYAFFKTLELSKMNIIFQYLKLIWKIAKQEYIFIDDYSPIFKFINLSKKTKLIQIWHAGVGFKSVGYARFGFSGPHPYKSCHRRYDYAIVGGKALIPVYEEVFGIAKEKILPYGLPRLDNFLDKDKIQAVKEQLYQEYPILAGKKVILFAPTFRGAGQKEAMYPFEKINLKEMVALCKKENAVFVIKMHPFVKEKTNIPEDYREWIMDLSNYPNINDLFYITDILITDYSSNIYDFSLLNKPIIFYTFDLDNYQIINKVHRPIREYAPGKVCITFEEVIKVIEEKDFQLEKLQKFREENFSVQNKKASDLIIDNIILKEGQYIKSY